MRNGSIVEERGCAGRVRVTRENCDVARGATGLFAGVYLRTSLESAAQGHFVGVLEIAAHWESAGQFGDVDAYGGEQADHICCGRFAFEIGVGCDHALFDIAGLEPGEQLFDAELVGADSRHGVDRPA